MDVNKFKAYMKRERKPAHTMDKDIKAFSVYLQFLRTQTKIADPDKAGRINLAEFVVWGMANRPNVYQDLRGIREYYEFMQMEEMVMAATERMAHVQKETRKLIEFPAIRRSDIDRLSSIGISTVNQLLNASMSKRKRQEIVKKAGISPSTISELVHLSALSRLPGVKKIRARLVSEAGLDTYSKITKLEPEEIRRIQHKNIARSGFRGSVSTINEAQSAVTMARNLLKNDFYIQELPRACCRAAQQSAARAGLKPKRRERRNPGNSLALPSG